MTKCETLIGFSACTLLAAGLGQGTLDDEVALTPGEIAMVLEHSPLGDPPRDPTNGVADDPAAARFGQFLFFDTRLSAGGEHSCATCHQPDHAFADDKPVSKGMGTGTRNTQTLINVGYADWFFWDGRADSLWSQALKPIERDIELGLTRLEVAHLMHDDPDLREAYESIFGPLPDLSDERRFPATGKPDPDRPDDEASIAWATMTWEDQNTINRIFSNVGKAIAAYERRLTSRRSAFDVFVEGLREDDAAKMASLDPAAQRGLKLFMGKGNCRMCHSSPAFTDGLFHASLVGPGPGQAPADPGRFGGVNTLLLDPFNALGAYADNEGAERTQRLNGLHRDPHQWGAFKTPTLRNVAMTAPYMHAGQFETLEDVVRFYSTLEGAIPPGASTELVLRPLDLDDGELGDLVAFLESLTDVSVDPELKRQPASPQGEDR